MLSRWPGRCKGVSELIALPRLCNVPAGPLR